MKYEVINGVVNRPILNGFAYDNLIPKSDSYTLDTSKISACKAVEEVAYYSINYIEETKPISKQFAGRPLKETCYSIQDFLSSHIRYSFNDNKKIKSPSLVWSSKTADCKSFTVFASSILSNLGIKHFLKWVATNELTHIYVVVPINQNTDELGANSLFMRDYYVIDGTINKFKYYEIRYNKTINEILIDPVDLKIKPVCSPPGKTLIGLVFGVIVSSLVLNSLSNTK